MLVPKMMAAAKIVVARLRTVDLLPASPLTPPLLKKRRSSLLPLRTVVREVDAKVAAVGDVVPAATTSVEVVVAEVTATAAVVPEILRMLERVELLLRLPPTKVAAAKVAGAVVVETAVATEVARVERLMEPRMVVSNNSLAVLVVVVAVATVEVVVAQMLPLLVARSEPYLEQRVSWIERHVSAAGEVRIILSSEHTD